MIAVNGSSFGRFGARLRRYHGGTENTNILATVRGSIPNRRAASRWLRPSICTAWRTRPYSSTPFIPRPLHKTQRATCCRIFTPTQPEYPAASVRDYSSVAYSSPIRAPGRDVGRIMAVALHLETGRSPNVGIIDHARAVSPKWKTISLLQVHFICSPCYQLVL